MSQVRVGARNLMSTRGGAARLAAVTASEAVRTSYAAARPPTIKEKVPTLSSVPSASARPATAPGDDTPATARGAARRYASRLERPAPHNAAAGAFSPSRRTGGAGAGGGVVVTSLSWRVVDWRAPMVGLRRGHSVWQL